MSTKQAFALSAKLDAPTQQFFRDLDRADARFRQSEQTWKKIAQGIDRDLSRVGSGMRLGQLSSAGSFAPGLTNAFRQVGDAAESHSKRTTDAAERMLQGLGKLGSGAGNVLAGGARLVGGAVLAGAGVGIAAVGAAMTVATNQAADFNQTLNILKATGNYTDEQMAALREQALALGEDMSLPATSANDAALAMLEMTKAGRDFDDLMSGTKGTLALAAAAQQDNARAAEVSATALNAFNLKGKDTIRVADVMASTVNATAADFGDLADAYAMASGVVASANQRFEDMNVALGLLANRGIKGSDAGTSLKTAFLRLQAPSDTARELMDKYGISAYDAQGKMRPLRDLIDQFSTKLGALDDQARDETLKKIFGDDAIRAARFVFMAGTEGFDQLSEKIGRTGSASELAASRMKGLRGAVEGLKSNLETAGIRLGDKFQVDLENLVRWTSEKVPVVAAQLEQGLDRIKRAVGVFADPANSGLSVKTKWTSAAAILGLPDDVATQVGDIATKVEGAYQRVKSVLEAPGIQGKGVALGFNTSDAAIMDRWATGLKGVLDDAAKSMGDLYTKWQDMHKEPTVKYDIDTTTALSKLEYLRLYFGVIRSEQEKPITMAAIQFDAVVNSFRIMGQQLTMIWNMLPEGVRSLLRLDFLNPGAWAEVAKARVGQQPGMVVDVNTGLPRPAEGYGAGQVIDANTGLPRAAMPQVPVYATAPPSGGLPNYATGGYVPSTVNNTQQTNTINVYGSDPQETARQVVNELRLQGVRP